MLDTISTVKMSREEWLEERRKSIGGSDAAAVIGMSRFASPYTVWMDKTGRLPEKEDTEAMRIGRDLEEYVAKRFEEASGKKVRRCNYIIRNPAYPWAHADIDRRISSENAGLECKTTSTLDIRQFKVWISRRNIIASACTIWLSLALTVGIWRFSYSGADSLHTRWNATRRKSPR